MLATSRLASYRPSGQGVGAMKQQRAILIAIIAICITVIMVVLVTRKDLCEVRFRTGHAEIAVFTAYESE
ncbi:type I toxin-antitoxin system Hok family toxin [Buttiauxella sp. 3AFRM03]|nr:type I toxin-antitoxin system Hok family toxin [Buttiauxella sp. 3AFRM03]